MGKTKIRNVTTNPSKTVNYIFMNDVLKPSTTLLCKLGSIVIHAEEGLSKDGHAFDLTALRSLLKDTEVKEWLKGMDDLALIPKKRKT